MTLDFYNPSPNMDAIYTNRANITRFAIQLNNLAIIANADDNNDVYLEILYHLNHLTRLLLELDSMTVNAQQLEPAQPTWQQWTQTKPTSGNRTPPG